MDPSNKHLSKLLEEYERNVATSRDNIELEIRIREDIDRETYENVIKSASGDMFDKPTLELSVNVISTKVRGVKDNSQSIMQITYNGPHATTKYIKKTRLLAPVVLDGYLKHAVGLSSEAPIEKFPPESNSTVRFKVRMSFPVKDGATPKWRLDVTAVKMGSFTEVKDNLKKIRDELFAPTLTPQNILAELSHELITSYEIEIEYIGGKTAPTDFNVVDKIFGLINANYNMDMRYQSEIHNIAKIILPSADAFRKQTHRLKQLSNQVDGLSLNNYYNDIYPPIGYYITDKADGKRAMVHVREGLMVVLFSDGMKTYPVDTKEVIILDTEMIIVNDVETYYAFDCMYFGKNISGEGFEARVGQIQPAVDLLCKVSKNSFRAKKYVLLGKDLEAGFRQVYDVENPYTTDGIIITAPGDSYSTTHNYKWKPYDKNTIDFLAVRCPKTLLGTRPYDSKRAEGMDLYLLFVGINHQMREKLGLGLITHYKSMFAGIMGHYYPIQFSPSSNPIAYLYYHKDTEDLDRKIIELYRNEENTEWVFHQIRTDRTMEKNYFGNDYRVAETNYSNYVDRFEFSALWEIPKSYFTKTASDQYTAPNKFKRFVISLLLKNNLSGANWIIDAAAGRGADLHRYHEIGVENALFIDREKTAITELIRRKFAFFSAKKRHVRGWMGADDNNLEVVTRRDRITDIEYDKLLQKDSKNMTVHTMVADLLTAADVLIERTLVFGLNPGQIAGMVCNFALHYMCESSQSIENFMVFVKKMLKTGGIFIFTVMSGQRVFAELQGLARGQTWQMLEGEHVKYAIRREYDGKSLAKVGQMVSVHLPFSDEMYQEPLCNIDYVISVAKKHNLEVEQNSSMIDHLDKFKKADRALFDRLTPDDLKYIELHSYVTLRKIK